MSQTQTPPNPSSSGPRVSGEQMRDIQRLRRSTTDRYIAGVAGGLGRHFDIDPTVVRVVLVVLSLFGGAGLVIYGAIWLLVPEDGQEHAPVDVSVETRRVLLIVAAVVAGLSFLGVTFSDPGWSWGFPIPLFLLAVVAIVVFSSRERRGETPPPPPWPGTPTGAPATTPAQEGTTMSTTVEQPPGPPAHTPPSPPAYAPPPPPKPRRTGLVLFWPTLALIAIGLGTLGIVDTSYDVAISAYPALALAISGVMLLVGAFVARPGGLIALGLVAALATGITGAVEAAGGGGVSARQEYVSPRSAVAVQDGYSLDRGELVLDLTRVNDLDALDGRTISAQVNAGRIHVIVPRGLNARVDADIRYAGHIEVGAQDRGGFEQSLSTTLFTAAGDETPVVELDLDLRVGEIAVHQD